MRAIEQFFRFAIVGFATNVVGYICYLAITWVGLGPKLSMTIVYGLGVAQSFAFNRNWSFRDAGRTGPAFGRYVSVYALGYVVSLILMFIAVDHFGLPHAWVQLCIACALAVAFFFLQRCWVFSNPQRGTPFRDSRR
jgi:putative flippase GtrA